MALGGPKPRALLAALTMSLGSAVTVDSLTRILWGEDAPASAHKIIQKHVSALRKHLGDRLRTVEDGYLLALDREWVDVARFETLVEGSTEADLLSALELWRGVPYADLVDTGAGEAEASRLNDLRVGAEQRLLEIHLERGRHVGLIGRLEELVSANPYREPLWGLLMTALYRAGRQRDALSAYSRLRQMLGDELGIEPSRELQDLEERILLQDVALASGAVPTNLPSSRDSFVGRIGELDRLNELIEQSRLVTLIGPAGSGKTRLALELGRQLIDSFSDGVWFVDLAPVRSPDLVANAVAIVLGVGGQSETATDRVLADFLATRQVVVILDNCEHLLTGTAEMTDRLIADAPDLLVVATSRERLGIDGETLFEVPPLAYSNTEEVEDADRLFVERARASSPDVDFSGSESLVSEIVRRLDGIPLAIELAAARVRTLGVIELRDRLDDRFSILVGSGRGATERHHTLQAALDWSFQLLDEGEKALFRRLSVFRGGFSLEAATEVCGFSPLNPESIVEILSSLVDKSLVVGPVPTTDRPRYRLLETMREFGSMVMSDDEPTAVRGSHCAYYAGLARAAVESHGGARGLALAGLQPDYDNLRKALRWADETSPEQLVTMAIDLADYWDSVGPRFEGHEWLRRAVDVSAELDPELHIDALLRANDMFSSFEAALPIEYARRALEASRSAQDTLREARSLRALSWALTMDEDFPSALEAGEAALSMLEATGKKWDIALSKERLAHARHDDPAWSIDLLRESLDLYREIGERNREALALYKLAEQLSMNGELDAALAHAEDAVDLCDRLGNIHDGAHARLEYGKVLRRAGDPGTATEVLMTAFELLSKTGDERCSVRSLAALGLAQYEAGEAQTAALTLGRSLKRGRELDEQHTSGSAIAGVARVMADEGQVRMSVQLLSFVDALGQRLSLTVNEASSLRRQAHLEELRAVLGQYEYEEAWSEGQALSITDAVALAVGWIDSRQPAPT